MTNIRVGWTFELNSARVQVTTIETYCREIVFSRAIHELHTNYVNVLLPHAWNSYINNNALTAAKAAFMEQYAPRITVQVAMKSGDYTQAEAVVEQFPTVVIEPFTATVRGWRQEAWPGFVLSGGPEVAPAFFWTTKAMRDGMWKDSISANSTIRRFQRTLEMLETQPVFVYWMLASGRGPIETLSTFRRNESSILRHMDNARAEQRGEIV